MLRGIHKLCEKGSWKDAVFSLEQDESARKAASRVGGWGEWTPLHLACRRNAPLDLIVALLNAAPIAAETFDLRDRLPVHYAAEHGASIEILNALVEVCPESITGVDNAGNTPLHLSFLHSESGKESARPLPSVEEVELLSDEEGNVASTADTEGFLPIHRAMNNVDNCSLDVVLTMICVDAQTLDKQNNDGLTPLHQALLNCSENPISLAIVKSLMGAGEGGDGLIEFDILKIADINGRLPVHCACQNFEQVPLEVMKGLLAGYKNAASIPMCDGSLPLDILEGLRHTVTGTSDLQHFNEKSDLLFTHNPNVEQHGSDPNRLGRLTTRICNELSSGRKLSRESRETWSWMCCAQPNSQNKETMMHLKFISMVLSSVRDASAKRDLANIEIVSEDGEVRPLRACVSGRVSDLLKRCLLFADRYELLKDKGGLSCDKKTATSLYVRALDWQNHDATRPVTMKFMSNKEEFHHEISLRSRISVFNGESTPAVVPMTECFDVDRIGTDNETPGDVRYLHDISKDANPDEVDLSQYSWAIVLEEYGPNLATILEKDREIESAGRKRNYGKEAACALWRLHSSGLIHGAIKSENFVRFKSRDLVIEDLNLASFMQHLDNETLQPKYSGESTSLLGSNFIPPEMIAKLDHFGVRKYHNYWKTVADDERIYNMINCDSTFLLVAEGVDSFLDNSDASGFTDIWNRISLNAHLWGKIRPHQQDNSYYVIKSYHMDCLDGKPYLPNHLPYDLVQPGTSYDTWCLGALLYEIITGENLLNHLQYNSHPHGLLNLTSEMFHMIHSNKFMADKLDKLSEDLIAKDLLSHLLNCSTSTRLSNMGEILQHPFFTNDERKSMCLTLKIIAKEKDQKVQYLREQKRQKQLEERTEKLPLLSMETQLKFEQSTWNLWGETEVEAKFPTTLILLPYKLHKSSNGELIVSPEDEDNGHRFGLAIANLIHYAALTADISTQCNNGLSVDACNSNPWDYSQLNEIALNRPDENILGVCKDIITRTENAEEVLNDFLGTMAPNGCSSTDAKKLVRESIDKIVDISSCEDLVEKAAVVEKALESLQEAVGNYKKGSLEQVVSDQLEKMTGNEFTDADVKQKVEVDVTLYSLIMDFAKDPLRASRKLLNEKINTVKKFFSGTSSSKYYLYLVDGITGCPVQSLKWPVELSDIHEETVNLLLFSMYLSVKSLAVPNAAMRLSSSLGLQQTNLPQVWAEITKWRVSAAYDPVLSRTEFTTVYESFNSKSAPCSSILLQQLHDILISHNQEEDFSELRRILSPKGEVIWSAEIIGEKEKSLYKRDLQQLLMTKLDRTDDKVASLVNKGTYHPTRKGAQAQENRRGSLHLDNNVNPARSNQTVHVTDTLLKSRNDACDRTMVPKLPQSKHSTDTYINSSGSNTIPSHTRTGTFSSGDRESETLNSFFPKIISESLDDSKNESSCAQVPRHVNLKNDDSHNDDLTASTCDSPLLYHVGRTLSQQHKTPSANLIFSVPMTLGDQEIYDDETTKQLFPNGLTQDAQHDQESMEEIQGRKDPAPPPPPPPPRVELHLAKRDIIHSQFESCLMPGGETLEAGLVEPVGGKEKILTRSSSQKKEVRTVSTLHGRTVGRFREASPIRNRDNNIALLPKLSDIRSNSNSENLKNQANVDGSTIFGLYRKKKITRNKNLTAQGPETFGQMLDDDASTSSNTMKISYLKKFRPRF